jgi:hypothetical protein
VGGKPGRGGKGGGGGPGGARTRRRGEARRLGVAAKAEEAARAVVNVATDVMDGTGSGESGRVRAVWGERGGVGTEAEEERVLRRVRASTATAAVVVAGGGAV